MTPEQYKIVQEIYLELLDFSEEKRERFWQGKDLDSVVVSEVKSLLSNTSEDTILDSNRVQIKTNPTKTKLPKKSFFKTLFSASFKVRTYLTIGLAIIVLLGIWTHNKVKNELKEIRTSELKTGIKSLEQSMTLWVEDYKHDVTRLSADKEFRELTIALLEEVNNSDSNEYIGSTQHIVIRDLLINLVDSNRYSGYAIISKQGFSISSNEKFGIGLEITTKGKGHYINVFEGNSRFTAPIINKRGIESDEESLLFSSPNVWVSVPIYDFNQNIIAALSVARPAQNQFSSLLKINRLGQSGESYVINKYGLLLTESRFGEDLLKANLVKDNNNRGMLELYVKDPGVNLIEGEQPSETKESWRLTKAAQTLTALALADSSALGYSIKKYRDYRGVNVIGSWVWMEKYRFGIITEMDVSEAYAALPYLTGSFVLLTLIMALLFVYSSVKSIRIKALTKQITEGRVGNYTLGKKIGEGGMSKVYLATHEMLKRPTAIKILKKEELNSTALERFKTEVKQVSRLMHPNTISIYDYGETSDGIFYYAMEYVDGLTIKDIVKMNGALPIGRAIHILLDTCRSLKEAHDLNLVHRDIKPQNIMLCVQGGIHDMVKVLDFGLVKDLENNTEELTKQTEITGTPLYMAPERITNPKQADQRIDIYAVGAVGFYLLAGRPLFEYKNDLDVMANIINVVPEPVVNINPNTPQVLSNLIEVCLDKDPDNRPEKVDYIISILNELKVEYPWSQEDAVNWWQRFKG